MDAQQERMVNRQQFYDKVKIVALADMPARRMTGVAKQQPWCSSLFSASRLLTRGPSIARRKIEPRIGSIVLKTL
jgi:hypothetical protein